MFLLKSSYKTSEVVHDDAVSSASGRISARWKACLLTAPFVVLIAGFGPCKPERDYEGVDGCGNDLVALAVTGGCAVTRGGSCCPDAYPGLLECFVTSQGPGAVSFDEEDVEWLLDESEDLPISCLVLLASADVSMGHLPVISNAYVFRDCFEGRIDGDPCNGGVSIEECMNFPSEDRLFGDPMCERYDAFWDSLQACIDKNGPQELLTGVCFNVFHVDDYWESCGPYTCKVWEDPSCLDEPY